MMHEKKTLVYSVSGYSKSGKTTLMTELITGLKDKDYTLATVKDCPKDITLDTEGKDTWKHKEAGAELAVLTTNIDTTVLFKEPRELDEIIDIIKTSVNPDLILVEGHKRTDLPKIWMPSDEDNKTEDDLENIVYEYDGKIDNLLKFLIKELKLTDIMSKLGGSDCGKCGYETCQELADQIVDGNKEIDDCKELPGDVQVELLSDGEQIKLNKFANNIIAGAVIGFAKELKGVKDPENIEIRIIKKQ